MIHRSCPEFANSEIKEFLPGKERIRNLWMVYKQKFKMKKIQALIFIIFSTFFYAFGQTSAIPDPKPLGKLIDIGGWKLHLYEQGCRFKGPSVILEAGAGDFSFVWSLVQPKVAQFARVYSYDRAGSAWSDIGPSPHTMAQSVYDLHTLLNKANVPRPYILVGHSLGGLLVRMFAENYPQEVAGLILVDGGTETGKFFFNGKRVNIPEDAKGLPIPEPKTKATAEDNQITEEGQKAIKTFMKQVGLPAKEVDPPYDRLPRDIQQLQLWASGQIKHYAVSNDYIIEELAKAFYQRTNHPFELGNMPVTVITRGKIDSTDLKYEDERKKAQQDLLLLSHNSKQIIAINSGHHIHLEDPGLIVDAIKEMVALVIHK
jgi:pimeloyl-ACP methyl ester carboxylesterase